VEITTEITGAERQGLRKGLVKGPRSAPPEEMIRIRERGVEPEHNMEARKISLRSTL
jgi:hypothetical protein